MATKEIEVKRLEICNSCDKKQTSSIMGKHLDICTECSCPLAVKVSFARNSCPLNKWATVDFGVEYIDSEDGPIINPDQKNLE